MFAEGFGTVFDFTGNLSMLISAINMKQPHFTILNFKENKRPIVANVTQLASQYLTNPAPLKVDYWNLSPSSSPAKNEDNNNNNYRQPAHKFTSPRAHPKSTKVVPKKTSSREQQEKDKRPKSKR
jgi:hypothetical protein